MESKDGRSSRHSGSPDTSLSRQRLSWRSSFPWARLLHKWCIPNIVHMWYLAEFEILQSRQLLCMYKRDAACVTHWSPLWAHKDDQDQLLQALCRPFQQRGLHDAEQFVSSVLSSALKMADSSLLSSVHSADVQPKETSWWWSGSATNADKFQHCCTDDAL